MFTCDETEFRKVARAVIHFNPHFKGYDEDAVVGIMRRHAAQLSLDDGYLRTCGFFLTAYDDPEKGLRIRASVDVSILPDTYA